MPTTKPLADGVHVSFTLEPDTIIGESYRQVGEEDWATQPITLLDAVVERLSATMVDRTEHAIRDRYSSGYSGIVSRVVEPLVVARVEALVEETLKRELTLPAVTPFGGEPLKPRTLETVIADKVDAWLKANVDAGRSGRTTRIEAILSKVVDREFTAALDKVIKDAREKALATVSEVAESALVDALRKTLAQKTGV